MPIEDITEYAKCKDCINLENGFCVDGEYENKERGLNDPACIDFDSGETENY